MSDYAAIRVSTLRGDLKIPFSAFVRVAGKYILFCREGDSFEGSRLERLKAKKLLKMYVPQEQTDAYSQYVRENISRAYGHSTDRPLDVRVQVIHGALQAAAEDLMEDPCSQAFYAVVLDGVKNFIKFFTNQPDSFKLILDIKNTDFNIAHHSVTVAVLALAIANEMGLVETRPMQIETLAVGCLIHDIEHNYNNLDLSINPETYTKTEKKIYIEHSSKGLARIKDLPFYDPLVLEIVGKHEERIDGTGPQKIKEKELDPAVHIVATANVFDHLLTYDQLAEKEALKKILIDKMGQLSLNTMKALQNVLKKTGVI